MMRALLLGLLLCAPSASGFAQNQDPNSRIAERDLREFKRLLPGVYTNEEQVYFQDNLGLPEAEHAPRVELTMRRAGDQFLSVLSYEDGRRVEARHDFRVEDGTIRAVAIRGGRADCERVMTREFDSFHGEGCDGPFTVAPDGMVLDWGGPPIHLLRARPFTCWAMPRKADGTYELYTDLKTHDQGGRVWLEATSDHPRVGFRLRNVRWPAGANRDSFVLYAHRGDEAEAESYTWASPDAERLGINTRWLQVSCTAGGAAVTPSVNLETGSGE
ncbi:MAG: hypothetical protein AAF311_06360 [Pseudomonadota bacterium]